jgi:hypothetical protein
VESKHTTGNVIQSQKQNGRVLLHLQSPNHPYFVSARRISAELQRTKLKQKGYKDSRNAKDNGAQIWAL